MTKLNLETAITFDVIDAAFDHDTLALATELETVAATHMDYAGRTYSRTSRDIAMNMGNDAASMARAIRAAWPARPAFFANGLTFSQRIIAFSAAGRVLGVPQSTMAAIADRASRPASDVDTVLPMDPPPLPDRACSNRFVWGEPQPSRKARRAAHD